MDIDYLIVGGGSAGAVLASRLSERPSHRVVLVEAGLDTPPGGTPADIDDVFPSSSLNPSYFWQGLHATVVEGGVCRPFPQAQVMGGGSSIMGMLALRGVPSDYARWAAAGAEGLSWEQARHYFRRFERPVGDAAPSVATGRLPIRTVPPAQWPGFVHAMRDAAARRGMAAVDDINEQPGPGFFPMPNSHACDARSSTARCYLTQEVRGRQNLTIVPGAYARRVLLDGQTAIGVEIERDGRVERLLANRVVLSAGGIFSPALLMRSGIGPADELAGHGIPVALDRPGVGRNLQNHSYFFFALTLPRGTRMPAAQRQFAVAGLRASSGLADCPEADLLLYMTGRVSGRSFGPDVAMVAAALYSPFSTGAVTLHSADPHAYPRIDFRMLSDPRDPPRVVMAGRLAEQLLCDPAVAGTYSEASLLPPALALNQFNRPGLAGALLGAGAKLALNAPGPLRRAAMRHAFAGAKPLARPGRPSSLRDADLLAAISPMGHPAGTCAKGRSADRLAVVDAGYRVHGAANLFVVDASVMPCVPSANTNLPTVMLAEHAAEQLQGGS